GRPRRGAHRTPLHVCLFAIEALELHVLLSGQLLRALSRFAAGVVDIGDRPCLEILDRAIDLRAGVEQIAPRVLPRRFLRDALAVAHGALAFGDVGNAAARVVEDCARLALARCELLLTSLELLDERRYVALLLRQSLLGARDDGIRQLEPPGDR